MMDAQSAEPLVSLADIAEIELFILKRMREFTLGGHASAFKGPGFNFVGLRDWEPGDRLSSIDWAQSSLTNFSPMITREFEQNSNATIMAVADASLSTRCGAHGVVDRRRDRALRGDGGHVGRPLPGPVRPDHVRRARPSGRGRAARDRESARLVLPRSVPASSRRLATRPTRFRSRPRSRAICARPRSCPIISDFLFADASRFIKELSLLNATHDVFLMMVDGRFAYQLPAPASAGWIDIFDIETGRDAGRVPRGSFSASAPEWKSGRPRSAAWRATRASTSYAWDWTAGRWKRSSSNSWRNGGCGRCREGS